MTAGQSHRPTSENEALDVLKGLLAAGRPIGLAGSGTTRDQAPPAQIQDWVSAAGLSEVTLYRPTELVLSARAGTPVAELRALLAAQNQHLPFEPADLRRLLGRPDAAEPSIGGVVSGNLNGSRRIAAGGVRDFLIGIRAITGRGELIRSGGRVMKNVTGYDLCRLFTGAQGVLGLLTEVTFKVLPRAEATRTLVLTGQSAEEAVASMALALGSPVECSGAAWISGALTRALLVPGLAAPNVPLTLLRLEHFGAFIQGRVERLTGLLGGRTVQVLEDAPSALIWRDISDAALLAGDQAPVWRLSVTPSAAPQILARLAQAGLAVEPFLDWGGGLIWLRLSGAGASRPDAGAGPIRAALAGQGHATLIRAQPEIWAQAMAAQPMPPVMARLSAGIRAAFDPRGLLQPQRLPGSLAA